MEHKSGFAARTLTIIALIAGVVGLSFTKTAAAEFDIGGALRYNFVVENYDGVADSPLNTYFTFDTWRINVDGSAAGVDLSFEYRFYPTFGTHFIHHGFLGYNLTDNLYMELGATQVPFGITTYASHSWWFQSPYYVGLEDDYDMGLNFDFTPSEKLKVSAAYFRQAEPEGPIWGAQPSLSYSSNVTFGNAGPGRYSYDITPGKKYNYISGNDTTETSASIRELNQFNFRAAFDLSESIEIGASAQFGGIYNSVLDETEMSNAFAVHLVGNFGNANLKTEYVTYNYIAKDDMGNDLDLVQMGAYGFNYPVAAEASMYVAGLAYTIPVEIGPISSIQPYVDYTFTDKANEDFYDMQQLVPGMLVTAGNIYTYVDYAMGVNQPWLTSSFGQGLGEGVEDAPWNARFNINIGYYF